MSSDVRASACVCLSLALPLGQSLGDDISTYSCNLYIYLWTLAGWSLDSGLRMKSEE